MVSRNRNNQGHLIRNMVLFSRLLRRSGVDVISANVIDLLQAIQYLDIRCRQDFKNAARTILVKKHRHSSLFDELFDLFWTIDRSDPLSADLGSILQKFQHSEESNVINMDQQGEEIDPGEDSELEDIERNKILTYSYKEILRNKDFSELTPSELVEIKRLMEQMDWKLAQRLTRRRIVGSAKIYLDLRRTLRDSLRQGGHPVSLRWRRRKLKRRPLVVLCDISGSMESYTRLLLRFIYVVSNGLDKVEVFTFGTRLTRVTHHLRNRHIDRALNETTQAIKDWGGGTRIGEILKTFNYVSARQFLSQGAIALIISDGWDCGDIPLLEKEIARLQRSCQRLIWLNPLLGSPRYEPLTRGIQAVLPYVDDFLPVHNLASIEYLGFLLENLSQQRSLRKQRSFKIPQQLTASFQKPVSQDKKLGV